MPLHRFGNFTVKLFVCLVSVLRVSQTKNKFVKLKDAHIANNNNTGKNIQLVQLVDIIIKKVTFKES